MRTLILILMFLISGCGKTLRQDPSPPAVGSNYPTAEIHTNADIYQGLAMLSIVEGQPLSSLGLAVQSYYSGTIRIDSQDCNIAFSENYQTSALIEVPLSGLANNNCLISVVVSPTYPSQASTPIEVFSFKGQIAIRVIKPGDSWTGFTRKVSGNFSSHLDLNVGGTGPVRAVFQGCGVNFDKLLPLDASGFLHIDLNQVSKLVSGQSCVLEGVIISPIYQDLLVNVLVVDYDPSFAPLPIPSFSLDPKNLTVNADSSVSVIGVDTDLMVNNSGKFKFDQGQYHVFRALTVKGRSVICQWRKDWQCQQ